MRIVSAESGLFSRKSYSVKNGIMKVDCPGVGTYISIAAPEGLNEEAAQAICAVLASQASEQLADFILPEWTQSGDYLRSQDERFKNNFSRVAPPNGMVLKHAEEFNGLVASTEGKEGRECRVDLSPSYTVIYSRVLALGQPAVLTALSQAVGACVSDCDGDSVSNSACNASEETREKIEKILDSRWFLAEAFFPRDEKDKLIRDRLGIFGRPCFQATEDSLIGSSSTEVFDTLVIEEGGTTSGSLTCRSDSLGYVDLMRGYWQELPYDHDYGRRERFLLPLDQSESASKDGNVNVRKVLADFYPLEPRVVAIAVLKGGKVGIIAERDFTFVAFKEGS
jgi:hypothetical protein